MALLWKLVALLAVLVGVTQCEDKTASSASATSSATSGTAAEQGASDAPADDDVEPGEYESEGEVPADVPAGVGESGELDAAQMAALIEPLTSDQMHSLHGRIDFNRDGKITIIEIVGFSDKIRKGSAKQEMNDILHEIDKNADGQVSPDEMITEMEGEDGESEEDKEAQSMRLDHERAKFKAADTNKDGVLSLEELPAIFFPDQHDGVLELETKEHIRQKDADKNGKLSQEEFYKNDLGGEDASRAQEQKDEFKKLDTNSDGQLTSEELKHYESGKFHTEETMKKMIQMADKDNDQMLTASELVKARSQIAKTDAQYHLSEWKDASDKDEL
jgi:Ca2+-binding EF-hand superfamily protein